MITCGITRCTWSMYLAHCLAVKVLQKERMPETSSSLVFGFAVDCKKVFIPAHTFSMGFKSGEEASVFITELMIPACSIHALVERLVCLESLSWKNKSINDNLCFNYSITLKHTKKPAPFYTTDNRKSTMILVMTKQERTNIIHLD